MRRNKQSISLEETEQKLIACRDMGLKVVFAHLPIDTRLNHFWQGTDETYFGEITDYINLVSGYGIKDFVMHSY